MTAVASAVLALLVLVPAPKNLPPERAYSGQTADEFQEIFDELAKNGWRLTRIKGYEKNGESRYDSEWCKAKGPRFWVHHRLDRDRYEQATRQYAGEGFTETMKSTWKASGQEWFFAVWELK